MGLSDYGKFSYNGIMSILPIIKVPDPILRIKSDPIDVFDDALKRLIEDMIDTMHHNKGVGLAAPQVGILQQLIVISYKKREFALINPKITAAKGKENGEEGCLSIPRTRCRVDRAAMIEVTGFTANGKPIRLKERGFFARILQHEIDHLNGILITDHGTVLPDDEE